MNKYVEKVVEQKVNRTLEALNRHGFKATCVDSKEEAFILVKSLIKKGSVIGVGGSETLREVGLLEEFKKGDYHFIQTQAMGLTEQQRHQLYRECFFADVYLSSSNAITEDGYLYNVDGRSNRVAALLYGPDRVIIVAGVNKIVSDLDEAIKRNREIAAPANALRLNKKTPCTKTLKCHDCQSPDRICRNYVVMGPQANKERITIILVNENLGF
ncbi:MAG: lactate utilization protein [Turicibacter sp.]|nr:lactate utilization protein [Turicibacter sp.]